MAQHGQDQNLAQQKKQDARAVKDAPLIKALAAKVREEDRQGFADIRRRRLADSVETPDKA